MRTMDMLVEIIGLYIYFKASITQRGLGVERNNHEDKRIRFITIHNIYETRIFCNLFISSVHCITLQTKVTRAI